METNAIQVAYDELGYTFRLPRGLYRINGEVISSGSDGDKEEVTTKDAPQGVRLLVTLVVKSYVANEDGLPELSIDEYHSQRSALYSAAAEDGEGVATWNGDLDAEFRYRRFITTYKALHYERVDEVGELLFEVHRAVVTEDPLMTPLRMIGESFSDQRVKFNRRGWLVQSIREEAAKAGLTEDPAKPITNKKLRGFHFYEHDNRVVSLYVGTRFHHEFEVAKEDLVCSLEDAKAHKVSDRLMVIEVFDAYGRMDGGGFDALEVHRTLGNILLAVNKVEGKRKDLSNLRVVRSGLADLRSKVSSEGKSL